MNWPEHLITSHTGDCLRECAETIQVNGLSVVVLNVQRANVTSYLVD